VRWTLDAATREVRQVLDLAAGTGKLTEVLLALDLMVTAVEPDDAMRAELALAHPHVPALAGTAEAIPLPAASVDAVLVGQAFHWFDHSRALDEIARVLRPGGVLGAMWNGEDTSVEWVDELAMASRTSAPNGFQGQLDLPDHDQFDTPERTDLPHVHPRTIDSLVDYLGTHSRLLVIESDERAAVLERIRAFLRTLPETASGEIDLPLVTTVLRIRRR